MSPQEYLLACLMEECGEVIHACGKALRFGLNDIGPNNKLTNGELIEKEFIDIKSIMEMLKCDNYLMDNPDERLLMIDKIGKVCTYMEYSKKVGCLTPEEKKKVLEVAEQAKERGSYLHLKCNRDKKCKCNCDGEDGKLPGIERP